MPAPSDLTESIRKPAIVRIEVNGEEHEIAAGTTVAELLVQLKKNPRFLAVERNRELVSRAHHADCQLADGDRIEIVTLVGGG